MTTNIPRQNLHGALSGVIDVDAQQMPPVIAHQEPSDLLQHANLSSQALGIESDTTTLVKRINEMPVG